MRFEHGRFSCKGGREMAGIIPTVFAVSCSRFMALWISQPSLLSFSLVSTFLLRFSPFFPLFLRFSLFSLLFPLPFSFSSFFPQFARIFPSPSPTFRFFSRFLVKATRLHVTPLSAMCPTKHKILRRTRHVVKEDFACFSALLGTFKKGS